MPELKSKAATYIEIAYSDFDRFVSEVYGQAFEIIAVEEAHNYCMLRFARIKKEELHEYDAKKLAEFAETGQGLFLARIILTDMCNRGIIEPGDYLIEVFW